MSLDNSNTAKTISFKIILIGQSSTGKTSLIRRYIHGQFMNEYHVTVGVDFSSKTLKSGDTFVQLQIWDTCGQDVYKSITTSFYRGACAVFLTYAIDNKKSFEQAANWLQRFKEQGSELAFIFLIGTKVDLQRQVTQQQALQFMKKIKGAFFIETSSLTGQNVESLFQKAADIMRKSYEVSKQFREFVSPHERASVQLDKKPAEQKRGEKKKKKNCCQ